MVNWYSYLFDSSKARSPLNDSPQKCGCSRRGLKGVFSRVAIASSLSLSTLLSVSKAPALAEGTAQIGIGQGIIEYGIEYDNGPSGVFSPNHAIYVDILSPNEVINVSLCGRTNSDDVRIEIYSTTPNLEDSVLVPTTVAQLATQSFTESNIDCSDPLTGPLPTTGSKVPYQFIAPSVGTYEVRLYNDTQVIQNNRYPRLERVDVTVTSDASIPADPTELQGRIYSYSWAFDAGGFTQAESADTDYFVKVPGGRPGENFVWLLDLNNFAGFAYEMIANNLGLEAPYEGLSAPFQPENFGLPPFEGNKIEPLFPQYLSYPAIVGSRPTLPPEVTNFRFSDSSGVDNSISPGTSGGVQDSGIFSFNTDVSGTYVIIIDANQDGIYAPGDTYLFGETTPGSNSLDWDGTDNSGNVLPEGTYSAELQVRLGEFHFVSADVETSGGGTANGLTVYEALSSSVNIDTNVYWDDVTILGTLFPTEATTTLPTGQPSSNSAAQHTWGDFNTSGTGFGNRNFIDTYVYGDSSAVSSVAIIGATDDPVERDYGDAPDTATGGTDNTNYITTESNGGPNHVITSDLAIGTAPDSDDGTQQNTAADADDTTGSDEGSITLPTLAVDSKTYSVSNIAVTNSTADDAFLVGWIDFDQSGTFDNDEKATATVASGGTTATLSWNAVPDDIVGGTTYARFRYSSVDGLDAVGSAIDGEVEDYFLDISDDPVVRLIKRITALNRGETDEQLFDTEYIDVGTSSDNDNAVNWPGSATAETFGGGSGTVESYLSGISGVDSLTAIANVSVRPEDVIEYTISFLSDGDVTARNLFICDLIPPSTTFLADAFNSSTPAKTSLEDRGLFISFNGNDVALTNADDGDEIDATGSNNDGVGGYYFPPTVEPSTALGSSVNCGGSSNTNGAVVIDLGDLPQATGDGVPLNSHGYIRFNVVVD